jgi:hypothetical protein
VSCVCAFAAEAKNSLSATEREMDGDLINSYYNRGARARFPLCVCVLCNFARILCTLSTTACKNGGVGRSSPLCREGSGTLLIGSKHRR